MRPVDKGQDLGEFEPYKNAQQPLIDQLGEYCNYCERWIASGIHVEHKLPQYNYPEHKFSWRNFLLACNNCNPSKGHGQLEISDYVWPDYDNTFLAFIYDAEGRVLPNISHTLLINQKIANTWQLLGFNKHPDLYTQGHKKPSIKDKRWLHRQQAWQKAARRKDQLQSNDTPQRRMEIVEMAIERGFWSIWMTVFEDDADMRQRLIDSFSGTCTTCFDDNTQPIQRPDGQI